MADGLNSFEINREVKARETMEKRIHDGIRHAQIAPESVEHIMMHALGVAELDNGKIGIIIVQPSGRQRIVNMQPNVARGLVRELEKALAKAPAGGTVETG